MTNILVCNGTCFIKDQHYDADKTVVKEITNIIFFSMKRHFLSIDRSPYAVISGHPGGLTQGNPQAFAPRHLQIPPTQDQYSSTKSYHCPSPREHNLKGLANCNCHDFLHSF